MTNSASLAVVDAAGLVRSAIVLADVYARSSIPVENFCSRSIINCTRSSELSPNSSSVVSGVIVAAGRVFLQRSRQVRAASAGRSRCFPLATASAISLDAVCAWSRCAAIRRPSRPRRNGFSGDLPASDSHVRTISAGSTAGLQQQHRVYAIFADDCRIAHSGESGSASFSTSSGKDLQPFRRDDHLLLAPANLQVPSRSRSPMSPV